MLHAPVLSAAFLAPLVLHLILLLPRSSTCVDVDHLLSNTGLPSVPRSMRLHLMLLSFFILRICIPPFSRERHLYLNGNLRGSMRLPYVKCNMRLHYVLFPSFMFRLCLRPISCERQSYLVNNFFCGNNMRPRYLSASLVVCLPSVFSLLARAFNPCCLLIVCLNAPKQNFVQLSILHLHSRNYPLHVGKGLNRPSGVRIPAFSNHVCYCLYTVLGDL